MFSYFWKKTPQNTIEREIDIQLHGYGPFSTGFSVKFRHPEDFDYAAIKNQIEIQIWNNLYERLDIHVFDTGRPLIFFKEGPNVGKSASQQELNQAAQTAFDEYMLSLHPPVRTMCSVM